MTRLRKFIVTSIFVKLILTIGSLMLVSVGILLYNLVSSQKNNLIDNAVRQAASYSALIKKSIYYDMLSLHREAIQRTIAGMGSLEDIKKVQLFDKKGKISYSSETLEIGQFADRSSALCRDCHAGTGGPSETLKSARRWTISEDKEGHRRLTYIEPIYNESSCHTASCHFHPEGQRVLGILRTDISLLPVDNNIRSQTLDIAINALIFMSITSLILFLFLRKFIHKPVSVLAKAMQQITSDNTPRRVDIDSSDEIGLLAAEFNVMSENLQKTTVSRDLLAEEVKERKRAEEKLLKSEQFLDTIFESIQEPFIILDRDYRVVRVNREYARLRNISPAGLLNEHCHKVLHGKDSVCEDCVVEKTFRSTDPCAKDKSIRLEDGTEAWFDIYTYPITDEEGHVTHVIEYLQDITHRKRAEKALKNAYSELEQIFNTAADGMCVIDKTFRISRVNKTFLSMFGVSNESVIGKNCYEIFPNHRCNTPDCSVARISGGGDCLIQFEEDNKLKDGTSRYLVITATAFRGADGELLGIVQDFKDITDRKRLEEELRSLSLKDELTGLYNRRGFITLADRELKMADRLKNGVYMLYADLDGMKVINDNLGHKEGDEALRETAAILKEFFRESDIIGRIGGDEFVILPIGITRDTMDVITARLQKNLALHNAKPDRKYKLSLSVGVAHYDPEQPVTIDELLTTADALMYEQKRGKGRS